MPGDSSTAKNLGVVIAVFAIVGVGIGLTGYFGISGTVSGGEGGTGMFAAIFGLMAMLIAFLLGPVVAAISGLLSGIALRERGAGAVVGGAGSFVGFYVMVIVAIVVIAAALPSGGDGGGGGSLQLGEQLTTILKAGIPSGIVGAVSGAIGVDFGG